MVLFPWSLFLGFPGIEVLSVREKQALPQYARNVPGRYHRVCVINPNGYQGPDLDGTLLAVPLDPSVGESAWVNSCIVPAGARQAQAPDRMSHRSARREQGAILADQDAVAPPTTGRTGPWPRWSIPAATARLPTPVATCPTSWEWGPAALPAGAAGSIPTKRRPTARRQPTGNGPVLSPFSGEGQDGG